MSASHKTLVGTRKPRINDPDTASHNKPAYLGSTSGRMFRTQKVGPIRYSYLTYLFIGGIPQSGILAAFRALEFHGFPTDVP